MFFIFNLFFQLNLQELLFYFWFFIYIFEFGGGDFYFVFNKPYFYLIDCNFHFPPMILSFKLFRGNICIIKHNFITIVYHYLLDSVAYVITKLEKFHFVAQIHLFKMCTLQKYMIQISGFVLQFV